MKKKFTWKRKLFGIALFLCLGIAPNDEPAPDPQLHIEESVAIRDALTKQQQEPDEQYIMEMIQRSRSDK